MRKFIVLLLALLATRRLRRSSGCRGASRADVRPGDCGVFGRRGGGDATAANQTTEIARLTSILTALGGGLPSALLSGALNVSSNVLATAALQTAGNASSQHRQQTDRALTVTGPITDTQLHGVPSGGLRQQPATAYGAANAVAQGSTTSGQTGKLVQGAVTTNAPP